MTEVWSPPFPVLSRKLSYLRFKCDKIFRTSTLKCSLSIPPCPTEQRIETLIFKWNSMTFKFLCTKRLPCHVFESVPKRPRACFTAPANRCQKREKTHTSCLLTSDWKLNIKITGLPHLSYTVVDCENSRNKRRPVPLLSVLEEKSFWPMTSNFAHRGRC